MARKSKRRKLELYRLTISGLKDKVDYKKFLVDCWNNLKEDDQNVFVSGGKSHSLDTISRTKGNLWIRFYSFTPGERPDVINVNSHSIRPNPIKDNEALLHWTHAMAKQLTDRFVILVERVQTGIWPSKIETYLQWMVDHELNESLRKRATAKTDEPITINLELEADKSFFNLVDSMDRIASATVRIVRPNPGWQDYDKLLGDEASASDARIAEVTMKARRGASLSKNDGIVQAMRDLDQNNRLGRAVVEGDLDGESKAVSTDSHGKSQFKYLATNDDGNVIANQALDKFFETMGNMTDV